MSGAREQAELESLRKRLADCLNRERDTVAERDALTVKLDLVTRERDILFRHPDISECPKGHRFRTIGSHPEKNQREWECPNCLVAERAELRAQLDAANRERVKLSGKLSLATFEKNDRANEAAGVDNLRDELQRTIGHLNALKAGFPDIGPDPLSLSGEERDRVGKEFAKRIREAMCRQQTGVPNQTALVWRIDLSRYHAEFVRNEAIAKLWRESRAAKEQERPLCRTCGRTLTDSGMCTGCDAV